MYGINQSRKTRLSGCLLARLPLAGPPRRGLSCLCFWPPRPPLRGEVVSGLFASPPPADLADGEASGSRSGLVSFSSPSALGSAKTANQPPCCYTERRGGANETGEIQTVTKSIRLFPTLETPSGPALGFFQSAVSPDDDIILHGGGKMKLMMSRTRLQQIEAESGSSTIHSSPPLTENLAGSSACRNSLLPINRLKAGNANSRSLPLPRLPVVTSFHGRRETYASLR